MSEQSFDQYLVQDEDGDFNSGKTLKAVKDVLLAELEEAKVDDGFSAGIYKLVEVVAYKKPQVRGILEVKSK